MPKISIISTYYNRKLELWRTLKTMEKSTVKDFEYIIVDDGSSSEHRLEDFLDVFSFLKLKRIEPKDKTYYNPCIPYNIAIAMAQGDIVILQSPECMYIGDPIQHALDNVVYDKYLVYSCYSLSHNSTIKLNDIDFNSSISITEDNITKTIGNFANRSCDKYGRYDSWFTHPIYRAIPYNFLSAMTMKDMRELGGFDERFADGHAFDDTDFLARIEKKKMKIDIVEKPYCLHQFHLPVLNNIPNFTERERKNRKLYEQLRSQSHYYVKNSFLKEN